STGYQAALKTGQDSVTAALGQKGLTESGAADKALLQYGQDFANQNIGSYIGQLQTQQQTGLNAAAALTGAGQNYANAVSANNNTAANTIGNAALSSANTINSAIGNFAALTGAALGSSYAKSSALGGNGGSGAFKAAFSGNWLGDS
uniref:hypothetical protein n=1 Tax=Novosphingobium rosa TaxID=76978 RepID=UPI000A4B7BF4